MTKQTEALKLALEALESKDTWGSSIRDAKERAITAIREALAEQPAQQEPAGYFRLREYGSALIHDQVSEDAKHNEGVFPLYTAPQPAQQQEPDLRFANPIGLTPDQKETQRKQFLAQQQEPVAWWNPTKDSVSTDPVHRHNKDCQPLYTSQPASKPQQEPVSDSWYAAKEIDEMVRDLDVAMNCENAATQAKLCDLMPTLIKRLTEQPAQHEPVAWTLTKTLTERETTTRGYLWFSDPQNCMWTPLYTSPPAQPQQEPVAWMHWLHGPVRLFLNKDEAQMELERLNREYPVDVGSRKMRPLVFGDTSSPASKPLTDEEIKTSWPNTRFDFSEGVEDVLMFARAIEAKLKEKNT